MSLFDIFLSPEKQIEREGKLLEKPNRTIAVVTACQNWDESESITLEDGSSDIRSFRVEQADFKYKIDDEWHEYSTDPREGVGDFVVGEQWIVKYGTRSKGIVSFDKRLRDDSPYKIEE